MKNRGEKQDKRSVFQQPKARVFKGDQPPSVSLAPGESKKGTFQNAKEINILDKRTNRRKDLWQYRFRDENGKPYVILGRPMLDSAFENLFEQEGGIEACRGLVVEVTRTGNTDLDDERSMGNYELSVEEAR